MADSDENEVNFDHVFDEEQYSTCGLCCNIYSNEGALLEHSCFADYMYHIRHDETGYYYPVTDDGKLMIIKRKVDGEDVLLKAPLPMNTTEDNEDPPCQKKQRRSTSKVLAKERKSILFDDEEELISAVEKRRGLWDITVPLAEKSTAAKDNLWKEVSIELKGKFSAEVAARKFKNLKDTFSRLVKPGASGSGRKKSPEEWQHFRSMLFLNDVQLLKETASNVATHIRERSRSITTATSDCLDENSQNQSFESTTPARSIGGRKYNKSVASTSVSAIERIADAIETKKTNLMTAAPIPDEIESALMLIGCRLRKIPVELQSEAIDELLSLSKTVFNNFR